MGPKRKRKKPPEPLDVDALLPLKATWLHILLAVAAGQQHGYVIRQDVEDRTGGRVRLWPATLYGALAQMTEAGLLEEMEDGAGSSGDEDARRRCYRLTACGRVALEAETRRLEELVRYARSSRVLGSSGNA
jgi:DNA-binding PadR family transcriptional regulator